MANWLSNAGTGMRNAGRGAARFVTRARQAGSGQNLQNQNLAQQFAESVTPESVYQTDFGQVLPQNAFIRPDLLSDIAFSWVDPEIQHERWGARRNLEAGLAATGGARFGTANVNRQDLVNAFERQRQERARNIYDQLFDVRNQEYMDLENMYYNDPNAFEGMALPEAPETDIPVDFVPGQQWASDLRNTYMPLLNY